MPQQPAVVLLHGFTHTGRSWDPVRESLGDAHRTIAPDIRGHGSASGRMPVELDSVLHDLMAGAPERFVLAGYSMGGRLALHLALAHPARVQRLILIGASPGLADPAEREARRLADERLADEIEGLDIASFAERWARTPVLAGLPDEVARRAHEDRLRSSPAGLAQALRGLGTGALPSLWERLGELQMPVVLMVGERDAKFQAIAQRMARALGRAEVVVVAGAGHAVHLERPDQVAQAIEPGRAAPDRLTRS
jgi:2-succinyl-6-hydroxy-2,4-cyclohexadiene-1-carboxylate synthase